MKITVLAVGKVKEKFFKDALEEYQKRLGRYCKLEIIEISDERTPDQASEAENGLVLEKEADKLFRYIREEAYVIALAMEGKNLDSVEFSKKIEKLGISGKSNIQFIIGGSLGLSKRIRNRADYCLSFSRMTFPHQLMRVILLEQIYRSYRIMNGEPYHK